MKKKISRFLVISIILLVFAPLVGYNGMKLILMSAGKYNGEIEPVSSAEEPNEPQEETPIEKPHTDAVLATLNLPSVKLFLVQIASLSDQAGADRYVEAQLEKGISTFALDRGSAFAANYTGLLSKDTSENLLAHVRETYSDAFYGQTELDAQSVDVTVSESNSGEVNNYFSNLTEALKLADEYADALIVGSGAESIKSEIAGLLDIGNVDADFLTSEPGLIMEEYAQLIDKDLQEVDEFFASYNQIVIRILELYKKI